ncbi:A/G-specific adenine glycosylase [Falsiporphyromonas endometrii]|uniref:Adenine DNA glycosylase n=1 Tax=Falsiporphyromonas endometrii TaxID=1387297 RepID=A0ABV9K6S4_9PORP
MHLLFSPSNTDRLAAKFQQRLEIWYADVFRPLPWRATTDPYKIWLSEVILQQTRIDQGTDYYHKFIETYPTINDLASAKEDEVLKLWQGLGYYSRARNLLKAAIIVRDNYDCTFPTDYKKVLKLPGIGPYTAAAILSFAFNMPYATVDGNVSRVISRVFAYESAIDSTEGKKEIDRLATELIDKSEPRIYNNAMMELGATLCVPDTPQCPKCPVKDFCRANYMGIAEMLPKKQPKRKAKPRFFEYIQIIDPEKQLMLLTRREGKDIWKGLYQPILIESNSNEEPGMFIEQIEQDKRFEEIKELKVNSFTEIETHILSHQKIMARLYRATASLQEDQIYLQGQYKAIKIEDANKLAFPKLLTNLFEKPNSLF